MDAVSSIRGPLVAVGSSNAGGSSAPAIWTSRNGRTWTAQPDITDSGTASLHDVASFLGRLVAFGTVRGEAPDESQPLVITGPAGVP